MITQESEEEGFSKSFSHFPEFSSSHNNNQLPFVPVQIETSTMQQCSTVVQSKNTQSSTTRGRNSGCLTNTVVLTTSQSLTTTTTTTRVETMTYKTMTTILDSIKTTSLPKPTLSSVSHTAPSTQTSISNTTSLQQMKITSKPISISIKTATPSTHDSAHHFSPKLIFSQVALSHKPSDADALKTCTTSDSSARSVCTENLVLIKSTSSIQSTVLMTPITTSTISSIILTPSSPPKPEGIQLDEEGDDVGNKRFFMKDNIQNKEEISKKEIFQTTLSTTQSKTITVKNDGNKEMAVGGEDTWKKDEVTDDTDVGGRKISIKATKSLPIQTKSTTIKYSLNNKASNLLTNTHVGVWEQEKPISNAIKSEVGGKGEEGVKLRFDELQEEGNVVVKRGARGYGFTLRAIRVYNPSSSCYTLHHLIVVRHLNTCHFIVSQFMKHFKT